MSQDDTLQSLLARFAERADDPAVIDIGSGRRWRFRVIADTARRLAAGLRAAGVGQGEAVVLFAPNRPEWVAAAIGLMASGAMVAPLDALMRRDDLRHALDDSGCRRILTTSDRIADLERATGGEIGRDIFLLDTDTDTERGRSWRSLLAPAPDGLPALNPDDPAALFYTSGTTGRPKGVPLTHRNLMSNLQGLLAEDMARPTDRVLVPLPLFHVYPFMVGMLTPLAAGAAVIFPAGISGPQLVDALRREKATILIGVPRLYAALVSAIRHSTTERNGLVGPVFRAMLRISLRARRLGWNAGRLLFRPVRARIAPDLELLASGGARLDPDIAAVLEGFGWEVLSGYGLTETSPIVTFNPRGHARLDTAGRALAGVALRIDGPDDQGLGEILVRGPNVFAGYRNRPDATREAFTEDGWFRTADLGRIDDAGYLHIGARTSERIVLSDGKNVFPGDVESVYGDAPAVKDLAVLECDGKLVALVVPDATALREAGEDDAEAAVRRAMREAGAGLPPYQRVADVAVTRQPLPRTPLGKLRRHELPALYERAEKGIAAGPEPELSEADRTLLQDETARRVWAWIGDRYRSKHPTLDSDPQADLGIDSLEWVSLTLELQQELNVELTEAALARVETVRDLVQEAVATGGAGASVGPRRLTAEQERWVTPTGPVLSAIRFPIYYLNKLIMRTVFRLETRGQEHLPAEGPFVLTPNHLSFLDGFAVAAALPRDRLRRAFWAGIRILMFGHAASRAFSRMVQIFPVDPEAAPTSSLSYGTAVVERGNILVWFPEGQRSPDGRLHAFLPGIGVLVEGSEVPVLPVRIDGTYEAWPRHRRFPRPAKVRVAFGAPVRPAELARRGHGETTEERIADALHDAVAAMEPGRVP